MPQSNEFGLIYNIMGGSARKVSTKRYIALLMILSLIKLFIFYCILPKVFSLTIVVGTVAWCALFYIMFFYLFKEQGYLLHCIISIAITVDCLYFRNFGNLPSVIHLALLPQLGRVGDSIKHSFDIFSFLFIADLIPLLLYDRKRHKNFVKNSNYFVRKDVALLILLAFIFAWLPLIIEKPKPNQVFVRYGLVAYHSYDIPWSIFFRKREQLFSPTNRSENVEHSPIYRGIAKGKNVIVIQLESFQNFLVNFKYEGQEITPNLNQLISQSIYFENYYQQTGCGNTADAEFVTLTSLHVPGYDVAYEVYSDRKFEALPAILKRHGYLTLAFHGNSGWFWNRRKMYPNLGFEKLYALEELVQDEILGMGLSDLSLYKQAVDILKKTDQPFFAFIVTLSSHTPFILPDQYKQINLLPKHKDTIFGNYLQAVHYADYALGQFLEMLKREGIYDNSVIILYGDHAGLQPFVKENLEIMNEILVKEYTYLEAFRVPFVIHIPNRVLSLKVKTVGGQTDFLPTVLNLLGIEIDFSKIVGKDLLNCSEGFVALRYHVPDGSFIDEKRYLIVSPDGMLQNSFAYDQIQSRQLPYYECLDGYKTAIKQIEFSRAVQKKE